MKTLQCECAAEFMGPGGHESWCPATTGRPVEESVQIEYREPEEYSFEDHVESLMQQGMTRVEATRAICSLKPRFSDVADPEGRAR